MFIVMPGRNSILKPVTHSDWAAPIVVVPSVSSSSILGILGHHIDAEGLHATTNKLDAIVQAPPPQNEQQLRSFL